MENTEDQAPVVVRPMIVCKLKDQSPNTVTVFEEISPFVFWLRFNLEWILKTRRAASLRKSPLNSRIRKLLLLYRKLQRRKSRNKMIISKLFRSPALFILRMLLQHLRILRLENLIRKPLLKTPILMCQMSPLRKKWSRLRNMRIRSL